MHFGHLNFSTTKFLTNRRYLFSLKMIGIPSGVYETYFGEEHICVFLKGQV